MPALKHATRRYAAVKKSGMLIEFIPSRTDSSYDVVADGQSVGFVNDNRSSADRSAYSHDFLLGLHHPPKLGYHGDVHGGTLAYVKATAVRKALTGKLAGTPADSLGIPTRYKKPAKRRAAPKKNTARRRK